MQNVLDDLRLWNESFDALTFFDRNSPNINNKSNAAYALVTSHQVINVLTDGTGLGSHNDNEDIIINAILTNYNTNNLGKPAIFLSNAIPMRMVNEKKTCICIIFFPPKISQGTFKMFERYMHKLDDELYDYLITLPWDEGKALFYYSDEEPMTNDPKRIIEYARKKIDYQMEDTLDANIIGYTMADTPKIV